METLLLLTKVKPKRSHEVPKNPIRKFCWRFIPSNDYLTEEKDWTICGKKLCDVFDAFITLTILVNIVFLCFKWPNMS